MESEAPVTFDICNDTELYQLCLKAGIRPSPASSRAQLIAYLWGEDEPDALSPPHPTDPWRHGLTGFVFDHWAKLRTQLTCPIRSKDPKSCWGCPDAQVITCVIQVPQYEQLIQLHRK